MKNIFIGLLLLLVIVQGVAIQKISEQAKIAITQTKTAIAQSEELLKLIDQINK